MHLVGRHGTAKHVVRSLGHQRHFLYPLHKQFATSFFRSNHEAPSSDKSTALPEGGGKSYAVLGGGVTGLSAAYFLARKFPSANVTIYETCKRLGGWVDSGKVQVDGGQVLFEWGPRSLRPDLSGPGKITGQLIYDLGLVNEIVPTHADHDAARNRFIYYPNHLVRMPGPYARSSILTNMIRNLPTIFREPIFKGVIGGMLAEPTVDTRSDRVEDESVGDFVRRRFGPAITDNMLSALFHGIYAGDIYRLSARTLLPKLWYMETRDPAGSGIMPELFELVLKREQICSGNDARLLTQPGFLRADDESSINFYQSLARQSVYTFKDGIGQITARLEQALVGLSNVQIVTEINVSGIEKDLQSGRISITSSGNSANSTHDYVISTLSPTALGEDVTGNPFLGSPEIRDAATVMVVNMYYSNPHLTDPYRGFGYLIPQSIPMDQNPERALGVIFASETSGPRGTFSPEAQHHQFQTDASTNPIQPTGLTATWSNNAQDTAPGTKLTVMLGGHWWDTWSDTDLPSPETAIEMAKSILARHMNIVEEPLVAQARLQRNAIPQYRVGYRKAMAAVHGELEAFRGRVRVAGPNWQGGVGVNDCIRRAWEVVEELDGGDMMVGGGWKTGLEHYTKPEEWFKVSRQNRTLVVEKEGR